MLQWFAFYLSCHAIPTMRILPSQAAAIARASHYFICWHKRWATLVRALLHAFRHADRRPDKQLEHAHMRQLFERAPGFMAMLSGKEHVFDLANEAFFQLIGRRDIIGRSIRDVLPELNGQAFIALLDQAYGNGQPCVARGLAVPLSHASSCGAATRHLNFVYQPIADTGGNVVGIFVQGEDRSEETRLHYLSTHDSSTDLPNHSDFHRRLEQVIANAGPDGRSFDVMILDLDLDGFKLINDSLGRCIGDSVLKSAAERLRAEPASTLARLSGDKFALIYDRAAAPDCADRARAVMDRVAAPFLVDGTELILTCNAGIAVYPIDAGAAESLMLCAERAIHSAKAHGRNTFRFYTPAMNQDIQERLKIATGLRKALDRAEFVLHYQPQVDLESGKVVGVEALLRWQHPDLGLLLPGTFIGVAEDTGLILPIGQWVMRTACAQLKAWQDAGLGQLRVGVNVSARQFTDPALSDMVAAVLQQTGLPAHQLDIELTESIMMQDVEQAIKVLHRLRALGVQLSMDDFGTGYSSLSYLKRFPINVLKIDRSFVSDIPGSGDNCAISNAIIALAHNLGMRVIAEGVENEAQCRFLSRSMCDEIQGYFFAKALSPEAIDVLLRERRCLPEYLLRLHRRTRTLLLVDDEAGILSALKRQLRHGGYRILTAESGIEGLEVLAKNNVDVVVTEQRMQGMGGLEFLRTVKTLHPDTVRIVLSGYTDTQALIDTVNQGTIYKFLTKPWDNDVLHEHVEQAFEHKELVDEQRRHELEVRAANDALTRANKVLGQALNQQRLLTKRNAADLDIVFKEMPHTSIPVTDHDAQDRLRCNFASISPEP